MKGDTTERIDVTVSVETKEEAPTTNESEVTETNIATESVSSPSSTSSTPDNTTPTTTQAAVTTKSPVTTQAPVTTKAPVTTLSPVTTKAPASAQTPETTTAPVTTAPPSTTTAPETTAPPVIETDPELLARTYGGIVFEEDIITVKTTAGLPYTRMITLKDGRLMMVYGQKASGDIATQIYAIFSSDKGLSWTKPVAVTHNIDNDDKDGKTLNCANGVPYQLADGTILVAYRANEKKDTTVIGSTGKYHSSIRIMQSTDNGKTFQRHSKVWDLYEENIPYEYKNSVGVWEPHLGMLNGELACFFAIGKSVYNYNHIINSTEIFVYRNNSWQRANYSSDETPGAIKNGMPVWQGLSGGGYIMALESNKNNKSTYQNVLTTKLMLSIDGVKWKNLCDVYIPKKNKTKSGAPYVVQLPNGQIVVSYMTNDDYGYSSEKGDNVCIFKFSVSKPGISVYDLKSENDFLGPYNVFNLPVGCAAIYGGMYVDDKYLYVYTSTNHGGTRIILRRAALN